MSSGRGSGIRHSPRRHPTGGRVVEQKATARRGRLVALLVLGALLFLVLRGIHALAPEPESTAITTERVVVIGVTGRAELSAADRQVISDHLGDVQVGAVSVRARYVGDCAAAGWTTLGAGRRAAVGGLCDPKVSDGRMTDWPARLAAAAARQGDARLGTLAESAAGCVAAVGPGAALAAARPDGTVARYQSVAEFRAAEFASGCPITLVDAGADSDPLLTDLAGRSDITLIVTGIGAPAGSADPALQVIYRLGTTLPGWLTSASTRREGIVTLTDLTRTLIDFRAPQGAIPPASVDGSPLTVLTDTLTMDKISVKLRGIAALSDAAPRGYLVWGLLGSVTVLIGAVAYALGRRVLPRAILTAGTVSLAAMMLAGAVPWQFAPQPGLFFGLLVAVWAGLLAALATLVGRIARIPTAIAGAALTVAAFTFDAALGGPMQAGSMLNSRPIFGLRWYGFGNVTFAAYATGGLFLAGYLAHRLLGSGRPRAALVAVGAIGFGIVACEGWPTMGTDFGGVIALTPPVVGLMLVISGVGLSWPRLLAVGGSAVVAIAAISLVDWSRGPDRRSHLGNFVQRLIDGDAVDVVSRKAVASAQTIVSPLGIACVVVGSALWFVILRYALPRLEPTFTTLRSTLLAIGATAVLGTLLNDGGISVWLTATAATAVTVAWFWVDQATPTVALPPWLTPWKTPVRRPTRRSPGRP